MNRIFISALIVILLFSSPGLYADEIKVQISGGLEQINAFEDGEVEYYSLSQLLDILGESLSWDIVGISVNYSGEKRRAKLFINSPYMNLDDTVRNITYPVKFEDGEIYVPAVTFTPFFDMMRPEQISWDSDRETIRVDSDWYNITDLAVSPKANGLLLEIFVTEPKTYEIYLSEGNWMNITIMDGTVNSRQILSRKAYKELYDVNAYQFDASAQLSLRFKHPIGKYTHRFRPNPSRIQISILDTTATINEPPEQVGPDDLIDKIVIDAGHGGKDYGAIGLKKTREKEIVLDIAKRLAKLIRKDKIFEVIMTRDRDEYVSLEERARIANSNNGDVYVSIHANASPKRSARGFQVFFLAPANNDAARAAAQLENAPFLAEANAGDETAVDDLSFIISDMIQTEFQAESADLAGMIDREFRSILSRHTRARGMDQAGFVVLNRVYMPSVLVEAAFLTNADDEHLLNSRRYRQEIAEGIYEGLKRFKAKYEQAR